MTEVQGVKEPYKESPLGLIPNKWEVLNLYELRNKADRYSFTGGPFGSDLKSEHYTDSGVQIIQLQNIGEGKYIDKDKVFTSEEKADQLISCNIYPNEIILAKMSPVARCCKVPSYNDRFVMCSDGIRLSVDLNCFNNEFIYQALSSKSFRNLAEAKSKGTTRSRIGLNDLKEIPVLVPPLPEQQKIAEILSTVDVKIAVIDERIQQTQELKKGLMQQLLTKGIGHTEFKDSPLGEIPVSWDAIKLSDLAKFRRGSFPQPYGLEKWYDEKNGFPFVQVYDVGDNYQLKNETKRKISLEAAELSVFIKKGTLILAIQGSIERSIGRMAITQYDAYIDRTLLIFQSFIKPADQKFILFTVFRLFQKEKENAHGSTIKTINKEQISGFLIALPPLSEQKKIAEILTSFDDKIDVLKEKKSDYQELKKGLMQQLLTGKKRVKV
jgi:type I restriction enzyme S subunit